MKALFLAAATIGLCAAASANASTLTIGNSLARLCFEAAEARRATSETLDVCNRALNEEALLNADRVATHVNRGILRLVDKEFQLADADFDRALAIDPNQPEAWLNKGVSRLRQGDSATALSNIARAIELNTRKPAIAFYTRGIAYENRGDIRSAYADLVRARDLDPKWDLPARELLRYKVTQR